MDVVVVVVEESDSAKGIGMRLKLAQCARASTERLFDGGMDKRAGKAARGRDEFDKLPGPLHIKIRTDLAIFNEALNKSRVTIGRVLLAMILAIEDDIGVQAVLVACMPGDLAAVTPREVANLEALALGKATGHFGGGFYEYLNQAQRSVVAVPIIKEMNKAFAMRSEGRGVQERALGVRAHNLTIWFG